MGCVVCGKPTFERHHVRTKKTGGPNEPWNLMHLCREHHSEMHSLNTKQFSFKYERAKLWLLKNGWYIKGKPPFKVMWYNDELKKIDKVREYNAQ